MQNEKVSLYFKDARSDKEYHAQLQDQGGGWVVNFQYGPRGGTLTSGSKTKGPVAFVEAKKAYDKLVKEKTGKGYSTGEAGVAFVNSDLEDRVTGILPQLLNAIGENDVEQYIRSSDWVLQEKHDGNRRLVEVKPDGFTGINRKGLAVGMPEPVIKALAHLQASGTWVLDGEQVGDVFHVFDVLCAEGRDIKARSYTARLAIMTKLAESLTAPSSFVRVTKTAHTEPEKRELFAQLKKRKCEGGVFKRLAADYVPGRPSTGGDQLKRKFTKMATCIVTEGRSGKRSVGLALINKQGVRVDVGNVTIPANKSVPEVGSLVEIEYLYAFIGGSLFQPQYLMLREDLDETACTTSQLEYKPEGVSDSEGQDE